MTAPARILRHRIADVISGEAGEGAESSLGKNSRRFARSPDSWIVSSAAGMKLHSRRNEGRRISLMEMRTSKDRNAPAHARRPTQDDFPEQADA
jgi:hypothetical protein